MHPAFQEIYSEHLESYKARYDNDNTIETVTTAITDGVASLNNGKNASLRCRTVPND